MKRSVKIEINIYLSCLLLSDILIKKKVKKSFITERFLLLPFADEVLDRLKERIRIKFDVFLLFDYS
jgi:hypothetical protein